MKSPFRFLLLLVLTVVVLGFWNSTTLVTHADPIIISGTADVEYAQLSPNQRYVVYSTSGFTQIFTYDLQTGETLPLTDADASLDTFITITPDNQYVIYSDISGKDSSIYRVPITGGESFFLASAEYASYSVTADSQYLLLLEDMSSDDDLYSISIADGTRIPLSSTLPNGQLYYYELSPSGTYVTYAKEYNDTVQRVLIPMAGGTQQIINPEGTRANPESVVFAESSNALFFTASTDTGARLYRIALTGGDAIPLTPANQRAGGELDVTADGRFLFYDSLESDSHYTAHRLTIADNSSVVLATYEHMNYGYLDHRTLSSDAPFAFTVSSTYVKPVGTYTFESVQYDPIAPKTFLASHTDGTLAWLYPTADGSRLIYNHVRVTTGATIYSVPTDGSTDPIELSTGNQQANIQLSPGEEEVFFQTRTPEGSSYSKAPIGGGTLTTFLEVEGMFSGIANVGFLDNGSVLLRNYENDDIALQSIYLFENAYVPAPPTTPTPTVTPTLPTTKFDIYLPLTQR